MDLSFPFVGNKRRCRGYVSPRINVVSVASELFVVQNSHSHNQNLCTWRLIMIKVSVMYPNTPGARFNHEYYRDKHMPLVKARMGDSCKSYTVDKGLAGGAPGAPATYVGMCHIFCDSVETFQAGFGPHAREIMADIRNYTDQTPVIQISEVVVG
jgi:uncharacterized protein (TIGR02118 family)